jgi:hypothetical protein
MNTLIDPMELTEPQLEEILQIKNQITGLQNRIRSVIVGESPTKGSKTYSPFTPATHLNGRHVQPGRGAPMGQKHQMSAAGRTAIAKAQKARWAAFRKAQKATAE